MTEHLIDLTKIDFWLVCLVALITLAPVTTVAARKYIWAASNLTFIAVILNWHAMSVLAALVFAWFLLKSISKSNHVSPIVIGCVAVASLFLLNKEPQLGERAALTPLVEVLSIIGYSYIALRLVEILRAVYEGRHSTPDFPSLVNYLIPFHMLAAGPIQAYDDFVAQPLTPEPLSRATTLIAVERIATGLFKKFVLAYFIHKIFLTDFEADGLYFFLEVQLFFVWLYLDFSAYSDIAVGVGLLLGVATPENFNKPYLARNMIDFWDRWHISLSQFIRRNIFIPVQLFLTRRTAGRLPLISASVAFTVAFALCGLWHGLSINFLLWGLIHAAGLIATNLWRHFLKRKLGAKGIKEYLANRKILLLSRLITYEFVAFSLVVLFYP